MKWIFLSVVALGIWAGADLIFGMKPEMHSAAWWRDMWILTGGLIMGGISFKN